MAGSKRKPGEAGYDVLSLLEADITSEGWEREIGDLKAFYVRGFTWFRNNVLGRDLHVTDCKPYVDIMKDELAQLEGWLSHSFNWEDPFSIRQFVDAASAKKGGKVPQKFQKAAETILLCEVIARAQNERFKDRPAPTEVYSRMRIQPVVSYIHGYTSETPKYLSNEQMDALRNFTGQKNPVVFHDMASKTVTHRLAVRTRHFLRRHRPDIQLGDVDAGYDFQHKCTPSKHEFVDIDEADLPPMD